jgi:hypothetical protein
MQSDKKMSQENNNEAREAAKRLLEDPEHRRLRAFHECGHAVWLFLDGRESDIHYIEIAPRDFGPGVNDFDTGVCAYGGDAYCAKWVSLGGSQDDRLARAARCVAFGFAGIVCEGMSIGANDPKMLWEDALLSEWKSQLATETTFADNPRLQHTDFGSALKAAYAVYPSKDQRIDSITSRVQRYLEGSVRWSVATFSRPDVWQLVEALAREFDPVTQDLLDGDRARQILRGLWGENRNENIPLHRLGPKWGRRYGCLLPKQPSW